MGEAKRRQAGPQIIHHHTSTLRTNQLWMSGQVLPEGKMPPAFHPQLGQIHTDAFFRRPMKDFPPVVWLTEEIDVPKCLISTRVRFTSKDTGKEVAGLDINEGVANAVALNRVSFGFVAADIGAIRWLDHPGYSTGEGQELNETAREAGDDPDRSWVSEAPIDLMSMVELRVSWSISKPKLLREDAYLRKAKELIQTCRDNPGAYVPPTWLTPDQARALAARLGVPVHNR
ncbi:hypothetical protein LZ518_11750 [Sphingomonas sp. RB56-2]|uniref:Uncharacterized protein n=1 Tax=Sphingomonas brevis TaxID=2908206 RepID=A0ABT0SCK0_9SPHN|nr:hypothetical protein [Sphingomonas brevis]MCL6741801.1 hypothetical protein [Sphingomonas brevis]